MNKLRDCAIVLGLAGMILMVAADTKDVEATGKISYERKTAVFEEMAENPGTESLPEKPKADPIAACQAEEEKARIPEAEISKEAESVAPEEIPEPASEVSEQDYQALVRLVEAEASGEDMKGKMLVAGVVLNRVEAEAFPDTIEGVVYQETGGRAQFSPVATGKIHEVSVSQETKQAVDRVLAGENESQGALYFASRAYADRDHMRWFDENLTFLFSYRGHEFFS